MKARGRGAVAPAAWKACTRRLTFDLHRLCSVASLYYPQPILITLADELNVTYDETTNIPTILQAAYAVGLVTICPMGDLVRRRPLVLLCVASAAVLSLILALVPNLRAFQAVNVSPPRPVSRLREPY